MVGAVAQSIQGYDGVYKLLADALVGEVGRMARTTGLFAQRVGPDVIPDDRLHLLLVRLRSFTDKREPRPTRLADLRPAFASGRTAPSKSPPGLAHKFIIKSDGFEEFLQLVADAEILSEGAYPCLLPALNNFAWGSLLENIRRRLDALFIAKDVVRTFVSDLVVKKLTKGDGSGPRPLDERLHDAILETVISDRTLLHIIFRMGVYQQTAGCPYNGLDVSYPADALRLFFAAMHRCSNKHGHVRSAISGCFQTLVDVVGDGALAYENLQNPEPEPLVPRRRKVLVAIQAAPIHVEPTALDVSIAKNVHLRSLGRTRIPIIKTASEKNSTRRIGNQSLPPGRPGAVPP
ncbi:hypothetical protein C8R43DRAFT_976446, partial [Mycena crocata]